MKLRKDEECDHEHHVGPMDMIKLPDPGVPLILSTGIDEKARTIYMVGEIDDNKAYQCLIAINYLDQSEGPIKIVISSGGGIEYYGYAIYDALRNARNPIIAEGYGIVASMAAAIFQAADVRYMAENCEYMIHNGSIEDAPSQMEQDAIEKIADQIRQNKKKYHQLLFENSSLTLDEIEALCKAETFFSAKQCLETGLADYMIKPGKRRPKKASKKRKK